VPLSTHLSIKAALVFSGALKLFDAAAI